MDVLINHPVAMWDVTGKQIFPREAEQIDHVELPVSDGDLRHWACVSGKRPPL